jgi:hypothetical protein
MQHKPLVPVLLLFLTALIACGRDIGHQPSPPEDLPPGLIPEETFPVDPIFEGLYDSLGGLENLGPALTPLQESGDLKIQYVDAALMVFDPQSAGSEQYRLAPLGLVFGIAEPAVPNPGVPDDRYLNGHVIFEDFVPLFDQLGGARIVGRPLTEARYNPDKDRLEQYFENLGFYTREGELGGYVQLLAYGAFACDRRCRYQPDSASIPTLRPLLPEPFASRVSQLGVAFVGRTLTEPYRNADGQIEIIFENLVLATTLQVPAEEGFELPIRLWLPQILKQVMQEEGIELPFRIYLPFIPAETSGDINSDGTIDIRIKFRGWLPPIRALAQNESVEVFVRPIVQELGIQPQPLVPATDDDLMVFHPIDGDLGHNVPAYFEDYLNRHGGGEISGDPITEVFLLQGGIFRQCFENLCLDFDTRAPEGQRLRPAALGVRYKGRFYQEPGDEFGESQSLDDTHLRVWESQSFVSTHEIQVINVAVHENEVPLMNREPEIVLRLPDNTRFEYHFPPTGEDGHSAIEIPRVNAPNGSLIAYEVCLRVLSGEQLCVTDNYLIWNYP